MQQAAALVDAYMRRPFAADADRASRDEKNAAIGLLTPAWNRGFWLRIAESRVEPERGSPEMK
jgi:hypothetical protein